MRRAAVVVALCLLAFGARVGVGAALLSHGDAAFVLASDDGDAYDAVARSQAFGTPIEVTDRLAGKWDLSTSSVAERWPRGYWLLLEAQYRLFGAAYASTVVLQAALGALGAAAVYALALSVLRSEFPARLAASASALSSTGVYLSAALYAESVYIPLLLLGLALLAAPNRPRQEPNRASRTALLAGAAFGTAELFRPLALPVFGVALVWCAAARGWRAPLYLAAGFALPLLVIHDPSAFTAGGAAALLDHNASSASLLDRSVTLFVTGGWPPLGEPLLPGSAALRLAEWLFALIGGAWLACVRRTPNTWLVLSAAAAMVIPPLLFGLPLVRYRAPADPLFIICMVAGAWALWTQSRWRFRWRELRSAPALSR